MRQDPGRPNLVATGGKENALKVWDLQGSPEPVFRAKNVSVGCRQVAGLALLAPGGLSGVEKDGGRKGTPDPPNPVPLSTSARFAMTGWTCGSPFGTRTSTSSLSLRNLSPVPGTTR